MLMCKNYYVFNQGDEFIKKDQEADENGWCLGEKDGKVGLFPIKFVTDV